jgi:hypothetical protein
MSGLHLGQMATFETGVSGTRLGNPLCGMGFRGFVTTLQEGMPVGSYFGRAKRCFSAASLNA